MQLTPAFISPRLTIPFEWLDLGEEETRIAGSLMRNLISLETQTNNLSSALALWDFCETLPFDGFHTSMAFRWRFLAMREGAFCLHFYLKAIEAICKLQGRLPSLSSYIDPTVAASAKRDLRTRFKRIERLRDTVAHQELYANPDSGMGENQGSFQDRRYIATYQKERVEYELTADTALFLVALTRRVFDGFDRLRTEARYRRA